MSSKSEGAYPSIVPLSLNDDEIIRNYEKNMNDNNHCPCPRYAIALITDLRHELSRRHYYANKREWSVVSNQEYHKDYDFGIPGLEWRPYYNSKEDEQNKPNLAFEGVEIRWDTDSRTSTSTSTTMVVNQTLTPGQWVCWYSHCYKHIQTFEHKED